MMVKETSRKKIKYVTTLLIAVIVAYLPLFCCSVAYMVIAASDDMKNYNEPDGKLGKGSIVTIALESSVLFANLWVIVLTQLVFTRSQLKEIPTPSKAKPVANQQV
mmetsp:Transcript_29337/g.36268  ORF Transcript_29337/g.36268 Transcript_29337/m.36268 type:complete len:106 (+) Transcript_29337:364-681(+)